jgi:TRAP-type C4-dicarboxylate transport system permease small subunit
MSISEGMIAPFYDKIKKFNSLCASLAGMILLFVSFSIFVDVFLRYVFRRPSIWITEVSTYLFLYMIFLATSYALQEGAHIKVTFLLFSFSDRIKRFFDLMTSIFAMTFCGVLLWQTAVMTWSAFKEKWTSPTMLNAPMAYIYMVMVIGSFFLLLTFILQTIVQFKASKPTHNVADGK